MMPASADTAASATPAGAGQPGAGRGPCVYEALGLPKPRLVVTRKPTAFSKKQEADMLARMQHSQRLRERYAYVDGDAESEAG
jgi:hypothetical protein